MEQKRKEDLVNSDDIFKYQLLSRLQGDCEYYLGNGNRNKKQLWAEDEREQIEVMKLLYNSFGDENKPEWLSMTDIENYEKQMVVDITLEERYTEAMRMTGYDRIETPTDSMATVSFVFRTAPERRIDADGWEALGEELEGMSPILESDRAKYEDLIHPSGRIAYYTLNLEGSGMDSDLKPVTYSNIKDALSAYLMSDADGKQLGYIIHGELQCMSHFDHVDMKNHITSLSDPALYNEELAVNEKQIIRKSYSSMKTILDKDNVYCALKAGVDYIENVCIGEVGRENTEWGAWSGRVANTHRPQDYLDINIMGYERPHLVIYTLSAVHANEIVQEMQYTVHTNPERLVESIRQGTKNISEEIDEFLHMAVEKLDTDIIYPMQFYSPYTNRELTEHYRKLENAGYDPLPLNQEQEVQVVTPDKIKDFVKKYYDHYDGLVCTEKISEVLAVSIQKMIDAKQMDNTKESIENVLCKESTLHFIVSRMPNVSPVPEEVKNDVVSYFEQSSGLANYKPVEICRVSNDPEDSHLYAVIGYNSQMNQYACWTSWNQDRHSLNYGHHNLMDEQTAVDTIKERFNDITDEVQKYGIDNTLFKLVSSESERSKPDVEKIEADIPVKLNGRRGR